MKNKTQKEREETVDKNAVARVVRQLQELIGADEKTTYSLIKKELNSLVKWHVDQALQQKEEEVRREVLKSYFTQAELNQLIAYAEYRDEHVDEGGWYYGNQKHFEKRHKSILEKLKSLTKTK